VLCAAAPTISRFNSRGMWDEFDKHVPRGSSAAMWRGQRQDAPTCPGTGSERPVTHLAGLRTDDATQEQWRSKAWCSRALATALDAGHEDVLSEGWLPITGNIVHEGRLALLSSSPNLDCSGQFPVSPFSWPYRKSPSCGLLARLARIVRGRPGSSGPDDGRRMAACLGPDDG
jgi:hypothetical protein